MIIDPVAVRPSPARPWRWIVAAGLLAATIYGGVAVSGPYAQFVQFFLLFAWSVYVTCILPGRGRSVALTISSLAVSLIVLEGIADLVEKTPPRTIADASLYTDRADLGWGPGRPGIFHVAKIAADGDAIYKAIYTIDADLLRHTDAASIGPSTIFLGDSFTFGEGVDDADTMPQAFADLRGRTAPVLNLGYSGYGPSQALRTLQTGLFDTEFGTPQAFVLLTAPWHVERTGCLADFALRGPRYTWDGQALSYAGPCATRVNSFIRAALDRTAFYRVFVQPRLAPQPRDADFETYAQIVAATAKLVRARYDAPLIAAYMRDPTYLSGKSWTDDRLMQRITALGVKVVDATLPLRRELTIPGDGHPTPAANRMRAKILVDALQPKERAALQR